MYKTAGSRTTVSEGHHEFESGPLRHPVIVRSVVRGSSYAQAAVDHVLDLRGGPKKSDSWLSEDSALIHGESRMNRSKRNETTPAQSLSGLQSKGSTDS